MYPKLSFLTGLILFTFAVSAHASREGFCKIKPSEIGPVAMRIQKQAKMDGEKGFPGSSIIQSDIAMEIGSDTVTAVTATYEAYLRVEKDGTFSVLPIPLATVELNHERNIVYICTHVEPDSEKSFLEIYFLNGYSLGDITWSSFAGDLLFKSIKVSPVPISPLGFEMVGNVLENVGPFPFNLISVPFNIAGQAQRLLMAGVNKVLPAGVERIIMTKKYLLLSTNVNLEKPEKALYNYKIDLAEEANKTSKKQ